MKRASFLAALMAALIGGAQSASADFTIQFTGFTMTSGDGSDDLTTLTIEGVEQMDSYTATAMDLDTTPSSFSISNGGLLIDLDFTSPLIITTEDALRSYLGEASSWTIGAALLPFIGAGETVTGAFLSLSTTTYDSSVSTGTYAGTITVITSAVPEPASMAMLAMGGLGVVGAARRRRKV